MPSREYMEQLKRSKRELPPMSVIAARIRDGESYVAIATEYGIDKQGMANRLRTAGYRFDTGEVEKDALRRELKETLGSFLRSWAEPWMRDAMCAQTDPEVFFPERGGSTAQAKLVCMSCPVQAACLQYALERGERFGIWGSKSERERRELAKGCAA